MRRLLVLGLLLGGPILWLSRRREAGRERLTVSYDDGSQVAIPDTAPGAERLLALARTARAD